MDRMKFSNFARRLTGQDGSSPTDFTENSNELISAVLDSIDDGVIVTDSVGQILASNRAAEEWLRLPHYRQDIAAWRNEMPVVADLLLSASTGSQKNSEPTIVEINNEAAPQVFSFSTRVLHSAKTKVSTSVTLIRDITRATMAERLLQRSNEDLEERVNARVKELILAESQIQRLQKLDALGRLAGGIAHDFNNLLGAIQMYCELMRKKIEEPRVLTDSFAQIEKACHRGAALTRQLLIFSRKHPTQIKPVQINEVIQELMKMLGRLIGENILIELQLGESLSEVMGDPGQLEQILVNLVINSREAMPAGGEIHISTRMTLLDADAAIRSGLKHEGHYAVLSIADTGLGMDSETQARVFEPFFTAKPTGQATGLGLSTVYGIVQSYQGGISLKSQLGGGTTFEIFLPAYTGQVLSPPRNEQVKATLHPEIENILIVEDDANLRKLFSYILQNEGYNVVAAANGASALEILEQVDGRFDLVLSDVIMPIMGGFDLAQKVWKKYPTLRFLFMSGYAGHDLQPEWQQETRSGFLEKPFNAGTLNQAISLLMKPTS